MSLNREFYSIKNYPQNGDLEDKIKFILGYAILAPSTHNIQPWLFKINKESCELYLDERYLLPQADQTGRDAFISLGFCWNNLVIASKFFGIFRGEEVCTKITPKSPIAKLFFINKNTRDLSQLNRLEAISKRSNVRGKFFKKELPEDFIKSLKKILIPNNLELSIITDKEKIKQIGVLTAKGMRMAHCQKDFRREMSKFIVPSLSKKLRGIPAHSMNISTIPSFFAPIFIKYFDFSPILAKLNQMSVSSSPMICVVHATHNSQKNWFNVGRLSSDIILNAADKDISHSIYLASVEIGELYKDLKKICNTGNVPQFLFCLGYMKIDGKRKTQRCSVDSVLK